MLANEVKVEELVVGDIIAIKDVVLGEVIRRRATNNGCIQIWFNHQGKRGTINLKPQDKVTRLVQQ